MIRIVCVFLAAFAALAQTRPTFEAAAIRPAAPFDFTKMKALTESGGELPFGPHVDSSQARYTNMTLRELIAHAWGMKPDQISGPGWMDNQRFDIEAKMPPGPGPQDAPLMLRALLQDRFQLAAHPARVERTVLALVVDKPSPKLMESAEEAPLDAAPLKPGEIRMETPDGPMVMAVDKTGGFAFRLGSNGTLSFRANMETRTSHMDASGLTMTGFAMILTQSSRDDDNSGPPVIDATGLHGHYRFAMDSQRSDSTDAPAGPVSESLMEAVRMLGLKLERRNAIVEQLAIDHAEKNPTAN